MTISIEQVSDARGLDAFIRFAAKPYRNNPFWVPPILQDTRDFLAGKKHFFKHCTHRLFMAKDKAEIVATAAGFFDSNLSGHWKKNVGMIGYFEALPEKTEAVKALFERIESFLRDQGAHSVWGPVNGGIFNPSGLLANAFNQPPVFLMTYNPSYYHAYFRFAGYRPVKDLIAFTMDLLDGKLQRKIGFAVKRAKHSSVRIRPFNPKKFREEAILVGRIYAETFKAHWGYAPQSDEEVCEILEPLKLAIDSDFILFAEHEGEVIGFVLGCPDYSPLVRKLNGNLSGLSGLRFIWGLKKIREARLIAMGVTAAWRGKSVAPLLVASAFQSMLRKGYVKCEYSWVLDENKSSQNVAGKFHSEAYKHYTIYEKDLERE